MRYTLAILGVLIAAGCTKPEEPSLSEESKGATAEAPVLEEPEVPEGTEGAPPETVMEEETGHLLEEYDSILDDIVKGHIPSSQVLVESPHRLLREGVKVVTWNQYQALPVVQARCLRVDGHLIAVKRPAHLRPFMKRLLSVKDAEEYFSLVRLVLPSGSKASRNLGTPLVPDERALHFQGEYGPNDARRWGIPFKPVVTEEEDAFRIRRPVLVHDGHFQVVLMDERVTPKGEYTRETIRVLDPHGDNYYIPLF